MKNLKKTVLISISSIILMVVVIILFISPITKYLIEKHDEKYTGRKITMDLAYVNLFTGYVYFRNLKIHEFKSDSVFFSANSLSLNVAMLKLLSKTYEIDELTLNHPRGIIIQNKEYFNFNDLIEKFSAKEDSDTTKATIHFNILNVKISDGEFHYREEIIPIDYFIKKVNFESSGKRWDADTVAANFSFIPGMGSGDIKGDFTINLKTKDYRYAVVVSKFDLNIIGQYLKDLSNYGNFSANLDADMRSRGNFTDKEDVTTSGLLAINDFHVGKTPEDDYVSFDKLAITIIELSPKKHVYFYDTVSLSHPYFKYERYDYLDNIQMMFGEKGANLAAVNADPTKFNLVIEIANYIKVISKNFLRSDYKINRFEIFDGDIKFNDFSKSEKFSIGLDPLSVIADSINKNHKRVKVAFKSNIKPYGNLSVSISINPKDSSDFDLKYHFQKLPITLFNPYIIAYTSFPLDRGTLEFKGKWNVINGVIQSNNHLILIDPRITKRIKNKDTKWIPMPLVMSFVRERGNVIDYEIPITGNLKDPKFHVKDVILDLLENIFIKPPTTPYRMEVKNIETEIEKSLTLQWQMRNNALRPNQEKFIERMADFLSKNPAATITVYPKNYEIKEKEYILYYEAKKKYFLRANNKNANSFTEADSEKVEKMSVKDPAFLQYLNKQINDSTIFTTQERSLRWVGSATINAKFNKLNKERENAFLIYFKDKKVENQIKFHSAETVIPYNGFSFYKIEYKGKFPEPLIKAYRKMNELNDEAPRKKFKEKRKKNRTLN